jgi:hypothetical protein
MLSPNATKVVAASSGGGTTVTNNVHVSVRCSPSVAVHDTVVCPMVNNDPDAGVHVVVTGALPFTAVAEPYTTGVATSVVVKWMICGVGHVIFGGSGTTGGGTGVGVVLLEQPATTTAFDMTPNASPRSRLTSGSLPFRGFPE